MSFSYEWLLIPSIATSLVATFVPRAAVQRGLQSPALACWAMSISFLITAVLAAVFSPRSAYAETLQPATLWIAVIGGTAGSAGICFIYAALRQRATGPVVTIASMSILVPILFAMILKWDVPMGPSQILGSLLTIIGTIAIHAGRSARPEGERHHWIWLAIGALLCFGFSQAAQKYITVVHPTQDAIPAQAALAGRYVFMAAYYLAGGLVLFLYLFSIRQPLQRRALPYACWISLSSVCQFICMLLLLQHVSTAKVYITFSGGGSILILFVSTWLLRERYKPLVWIGCLLGITGIVLMRL